MDERILETILEIVHRRRPRRRTRQNVREDRRRATGGGNRRNRLTGRQTSVDQRVDDDRAVDAAVVHAVAAANARLAIAAGVHRKTDSWSKIILVTRTVAGLRQSRVDEERFRKLLVVPTQSEVECEPRRHAPIILRKERPVDRGQLEARRSEALLVIARVALARDSRTRRTNNAAGSQSAIGGKVCVVNDKVVDVRVSVRTSAGEQVLVDVSDVVDVSTKLERVVAAGIGDAVGELKTPLIRQSN